MTPIQLLVVDDHNLFRRGLTALLSQDGRFEVCEQAGDIGEALRCLQRSQPDLILLDNHLPGVRGVDGIAALKDAAPEARILMLTVSENEDDLAAALQAGADGYLLKTVESDDLCNSIEKVLAGESVVSPAMMTKLVTAFRTKPAPAVTEAAAPNANDEPRDSNKVIARTLDIAETTVKVHVQHILRKLELTSRVQAAVYASVVVAG
jgi:two-component system nitrate/nitrite response regulator NarL